MEVMYFVPTASLDSNAKLKNYLAKVPCCDELQTLEKTSAQVWIVVLTQKLCQQTLATCKLRQQLDPSQKFIFLVDQKELCFWMYRYQLQVTAVIFCYAKTWYQELLAALQELEKATELCFKSRGKVIKVELEQICYVESHCSNTHAAVLWLMDKRPLQVPKNLRILEKENPRLWRSHQSYFLNPGNVYMLDKLNATATFVNGLKCPISRQKFKTLAERFA
ncbi:LytTR family transcriptional regulator DNA-binding domain-containing protein [Ligilactobacillus murinus]|uniref:LytTR family transcriptional regulator DNA-binding domain-containing protein n=1 Tax=Ligilactobacillus murinus TaxID=1622 RepID=UPI00109463A5|nr:LytTR family transcriptional regulator DNA-binding domain-containing protein [Ligilactobacillus murinus]TGY52149.1 LytTR family transcriptional regulator [Ligilactobacillus murinus]